MRALLAAIAMLPGSTVGRSKTAAKARVLSKLQGIQDKTHKKEPLRHAEGERGKGGEGGKGGGGGGEGAER